MVVMVVVVLCTMYYVLFAIQDHKKAVSLNKAQTNTRHSSLNIQHSKPPTDVLSTGRRPEGGWNGDCVRLRRESQL